MNFEGSDLQSQFAWCYPNKFQIMQTLAYVYFWVMEFDNFSKFLIIEMSLFTLVKKTFFGEVMKIDKNLGASSKFSQLSIFLSFIPQEKKM